MRASATCISDAAANSSFLTVRTVICVAHDFNVPWKTDPNPSAPKCFSKLPVMARKSVNLNRAAWPALAARACLASAGATGAPEAPADASDTGADTAAAAVAPSAGEDDAYEAASVGLKFNPLCLFSGSQCLASGTLCKHQNQPALRREGVRLPSKLPSSPPPPLPPSSVP
jgi:hypothetical protein